MKQNQTITSMEAINMFGATRLSAIIYDLKDDGYNITKVMKSSKNRFGNHVSYAEYRLIP